MLELAIVVPAFNERDNVVPLLACLNTALAAIDYEVIFVDDDSADGTADLVREISLTNPRVRVLQRIGRRGLASACVEGMLSTAAPYIAVMDADLQHDETILPQMLAQLKSERLDLVVATRNVAGGSMGDFSRQRVRISQLGRRLGKIIMHSSLSDPMSGFFIMDRRFFEEVARSLSGIGFKILLDIVASSKRPVRLGEVPYHFRNRLRGESKLDILVAIEYLYLLVDKLVGSVLPVRFVIFGMVGAVGAVAYVGMVFVLQHVLHLSFLAAQTVSTIVAMVVNFFLNNSVTYRDRRLRGWRIWTGLLSFCAACSMGVVINVRLAQLAHDAGVVWYLASLLGLAVGSVWNYGVTAIFTWRISRRRAQETVSAAPAVRRPN